MATIKEKRNTNSTAQREAVAAKRKGSTASSEPQDKENATPGTRSRELKKPRLAVEKDPAIAQLEEKIELEYKIREGARKLLQASNGPAQSMEASKGLFVANAKIIALMREMQWLQTETTAVERKKDGKTRNTCPAILAISDIRIPLEWQEFESTQGKVDSHAQFGVFCLFRVGNQVMDTPSLVQVDRNTMDITFRDIIIFPNKVDSDFSLEVEVYCSLPPEEPTGHHKPSTPIKMLKKLRGTKSQDRFEELTTLNTLTSPFHDLPASAPPFRFALAGHTHLTLTDICHSQSCGTYVLKRGAVGSSGTASTGAHEIPLLPLWGQICCKLMAQPDCATQARMSGFINIQRMVSGLPDWMRLWCVMRQNHLRCWKNPEDVGRKMPEQVVHLSEGMTVEPAARLLMRRPNTLVLRDSHHLSELFLAFESKEEREGWMATFLQALLDLKVWRSSCDFVIPRPGSKFYVSSPSSSLYNTKDSNNMPKMAMDAENNIPHYASKFYVDFPSLVKDTPKAASGGGDKATTTSRVSMTQL